LLCKLSFEDFGLSVCVDMVASCGCILVSGCLWFEAIVVRILGMIWGCCVDESYGLSDVLLRLDYIPNGH
jgi:hypothetical protein